LQVHIMPHIVSPKASEWWRGRRWLIRHSAGDYKTGRSYGERPPLVLAHHLNAELEAWIDTWRAKLSPQHDFLFTRRG
jgi:hypothetical protein